MKNIKFVDKSTIPGWEYILLHVASTIICFLWYRYFLFIPIEAIGSAASSALLFFFMGAASLVGISIGWKRFMGILSALTDVLTGIGIYSLITYAPYYKVRFIVMSIIMVFLIVIDGMYVFSKRVRGHKFYEIEDRCIRTFVIKGKIAHTLNESGIWAGVFSIIMVASLMYSRYISGGILIGDYTIIEKVTYSSNHDSEDTSLSNNIEIAMKIRDHDSWINLSTEEKLSVLQWLCDYETDRMGIDRIQVVMDDLGSEHGSGTYTLGCYDMSEGVIIVDRRHLQTSDNSRVAETMFHEIYHAYEEALVSLYYSCDEEQRKLMVFDHVPQYIKESYEYVDGKEDFSAYQAQSTETDSRDYAEKRVGEFFDEIDTYVI